MITDSHCHLDYFTGDELDRVVARAGEAGVDRLVTIGTSMAQAAAVKKITERFPSVWGTVGVHPQQAGAEPVPAVTDLIVLADHPRVIGIGETGLDYHYDTSPRDVQITSFRHHIRAAKETGLPLVIHARAADDDILAILQEERAGEGTIPLLHCFSSSRFLAEGVLSLGGYISFSGILTFPKSHDIRSIAADVPMDRLLVETDAPYLAPVPRRGQPNEPAHVIHTAGKLAELRGMDLDTLATITSDNFNRLFRKVV